MDVSVIQAITATFTHPDYVTPEIGIIMNFNNEKERLARILKRNSSEPDRFELEKSDFQLRVNRGYENIAKDRGVPVVDAGMTIKQIQAEIRQIIGV